jgi:hypothetical protein
MSTDELVRMLADRVLILAVHVEKNTEATLLAQKTISEVCDRLLRVLNTTH